MIKLGWIAGAVCVCVCFSGCTKRPQNGNQAPGSPAGGSGSAASPDSKAGGATSSLSAGSSLKGPTNYKVVPAASPGALGTLEVTAIYTTTEIPEQSEIPVNINVEYCTHKVVTEDLIVDKETRGLKNVVVRLEGLTEGARKPPAQITVRNHGCSFVPHVSVAVKGTRLEIRNDDPVFHTTHPYINGNHFFNISLQKKGEPGDVSPRPRPLRQTGVIEFNCDVHKWMRGYAIIHTNPYIAVSDAKGKIVLDEIPPGEHRYVAWHEQLGEKRGTVKIEANGVAHLNLKFELPQ